MSSVQPREPAEDPGCPLSYLAAPRSWQIRGPSYSFRGLLEGCGSGDPSARIPLSYRPLEFPFRTNAFPSPLATVSA